MNKDCKNCRHAKFYRYLSQDQEIRRLMASALYEGHPPSLKEKYRMLEEIASEFCKLGHINRNNGCEHYKRKWWKFWVKQR